MRDLRISFNTHDLFPGLCPDAEVKLQASGSSFVAGGLQQASGGSLIVHDGKVVVVLKRGLVSADFRIPLALCNTPDGSFCSVCVKKVNEICSARVVLEKYHRQPLVIGRDASSGQDDFKASHGECSHADSRPNNSDDGSMRDAIIIPDAFPLFDATLNSSDCTVREKAFQMALDSDEVFSDEESSLVHGLNSEMLVKALEHHPSHDDEHEVLQDPEILCLEGTWEVKSTSISGDDPTKIRLQMRPNVLFVPTNSSSVPSSPQPSTVMSSVLESSGKVGDEFGKSQQLPGQVATVIKGRKRKLPSAAGFHRVAENQQWSVEKNFLRPGHCRTHEGLKFPHLPALMDHLHSAHNMCVCFACLEAFRTPPSLQTHLNSKKHIYAVTRMEAERMNSKSQGMEDRSLDEWKSIADFHFSPSPIEDSDDRERLVNPPLESDDAMVFVV